MRRSARDGRPGPGAGVDLERAQDVLLKAGAAGDGGDGLLPGAEGDPERASPPRGWVIAFALWRHFGSDLTRSAPEPNVRNRPKRDIAGLKRYELPP
jgi:hypothetical protein